MTSQVSVLECLLSVRRRPGFLHCAVKVCVLVAFVEQALKSV